MADQKQTSWGSVADWYDGMLEDSADSYQKNVIMPNVMRILAPHKGMSVIDIACGQGYFSRAFAENGATVIGYDLSKELIDLAKAQEDKRMLGKTASQGARIAFHVSPADSLPFMADASMDAAVIVLALQNIDSFAGVLAEAGRILKAGGRLILVLNHPAFRIPQSSGWGWDEKASTQYRRVDAYMSDQTLKIDMTPGEPDPKKKKMTVSFHRPLQSYFKALNKAGLAVIRLEEWISHKKSQKGPRAAEEDRTRKEVPMFVCIEAKKL